MFIMCHSICSTAVYPKSLVRNYNYLSLLQAVEGYIGPVAEVGEKVVPVDGVAVDIHTCFANHQHQI